MFVANDGSKRAGAAQLLPPGAPPSPLRSKRARSAADGPALKAAIEVLHTSQVRSNQRRAAHLCGRCRGPFMHVGENR